MNALEKESHLEIVQLPKGNKLLDLNEFFAEIYDRWKYGTIQCKVIS